MTRLSHKNPLSGRLCCLLLLALLVTGCVRQGIYHQVKQGQTLYRISRAYSINEAYLARINGISDPTRLRAGTRLFVPGATEELRVPATVPKFSPPKVAKSSRPATRAKQSVKTAARPPVKTASKATPTSRKLSVRQKTTPIKKLHWPLRGKILRSFSGGGNGGGKGLEIAAREGTRVLAAAAGKVIYSGDGVKGYGHLMIIQHENDLYTVYGFNRRNLVGQGEFVSQGEKIALSGVPPSGGSARLHFEVRRGKQAINPILYLP